MAGVALWAQFATPEESALIEGLSQSQFPCVLVDRYLPGLEADFVGTANRVGFEHLTSTLIGRGHRTIAFVSRDQADSVMVDRLAGYRHALSKAGIAFNQDIVEEKGYTFAGDERAVRAMFDSPHRPTAVVCSDNWTAVHVTRALATCELTVPDDVQLATMDDFGEPGVLTRPNWLTAVQDGIEIGRQVGDLLLSRISAPSKLFEQRFVRPLFLFPEFGLGLPATTSQSKERR